MFDLDERIRDWRATMLASMGDQAETVDELEGHLREEIQRLKRAGRPPEEAFVAAVARLGDCGELAAEFRKVPTLGPLSWRPAQVLLAVCGLLTLVLAGYVVKEVWQGKVSLLLASHVFAVTVGYSVVFAVGALAVWSLVARVALGWNDVRSAALRATMRSWTIVGLALTTIGIVLGAVWARGHLGRFWGWDVKESAALAVLAWNVVVLALVSRRRADPRLAMLIGLAGNVVVTLCWFGPNLVHSGLHAYGGVSWTPLVGFVAIQGLLVLLALAPPGLLRRVKGC